MICLLDKPVHLFAHTPKPGYMTTSTTPHNLSCTICSGNFAFWDVRTIDDRLIRGWRQDQAASRSFYSRLFSTVSK